MTNDPQRQEAALSALAAGLAVAELRHRRVDGVPQWCITGPSQRQLAAILNAANAVHFSHRVQLMSIEAETDK